MYAKSFVFEAFLSYKCYSNTIEGNNEGIKKKTLIPIFLTFYSIIYLSVIIQLFLLTSFCDLTRGENLESIK